MKYFPTGIAMALLLIVWNNSIAQSLETDFSLSAEGGSVSNTYLMPFIPEWDRSRISGFTSLSPAGQFRWRGSGRSATLYGAGHFLHFYDDRPTWTGGYLTPVFRQHIASGFSARASGGWSYYSSTYSRNINWLFAGMEWVPSPFVKLGISAGSGWRTYRGLLVRPDETRRYDSYGLEFQYWPRYRWQLRTTFQSSLAHLRRPADGFTISVAAVHYRRSGMSIVLQTGLEQYSMEFQSNLSNGALIIPGTIAGIPVTSENETAQVNEVIRLENRFLRTFLRVSHPYSDWVTLTGTLSGLLWLGSEDNDIVSDFQVSAGVQIPLSFPISRTGEIRSIRWNTQKREEQDQKPKPEYEPDSADPMRDQELALDQNQKLLATLSVQYKGNASLYLTGDFIDWDDPGIPLHRTGRNRYRVELDLSAGVYEYKIRKRTNSRHEWLELPDNVSTVRDGFGGKNGRLFIDY